MLAKAGLASDRERSRVVIEKPIGYDLESARKLNRVLTHSFHESQIFRIDHYLGKETVQNILAFRFANPLFEPIWDQRFIDHVAITVAEQIGVEHRGGYYDHAGALRDMVQNHLLQLLCLVAMEAPVSFGADEIRNKKVDVLHAIRPIAPDKVAKCAVRGQNAVESGHVCVSKIFLAVSLESTVWPLLYPCAETSVPQGLAGMNQFNRCPCCGKRPVKRSWQSRVANIRTMYSSMVFLRRSKMFPWL